MYDDMPPGIPLSPAGSSTPFIPPPPGARYGEDYDDYGYGAPSRPASRFGTAPRQGTPWPTQPGGFGLPADTPQWMRQGEGSVNGCPASSTWPAEPLGQSYFAPATPSRYAGGGASPMHVRTTSAPPQDQQSMQWPTSPGYQQSYGSQPSSPFVAQPVAAGSLVYAPTGAAVAYASTPALVRSRSSGSRYWAHRRPAADRPSEWRRDFSFRGGLTSLFRRMSFSTPNPPDWSDGEHHKLHRYIRYTSARPPMSMDLRRPPEFASFAALKRPAHGWDLTRLACEPPLPHMRMYHAQYPWYIDAVARGPAGVTLQDVLGALHADAMRQIRQSDFYNEELDEADRGALTEAYRARCRMFGEDGMGIRRVEFLRGKVIFEGLVKGKNGMWEVKTTKP